MNTVSIVGGGAAGMIAAAAAAEYGARVTVFEKNEKLGKKLYITGKGRCNVTNDCDWEEFFDSVVSNPKFLYSSFGAFNNRDMMEWLTSRGLKLKTERGSRVFPLSDKSSDVIKALQMELERLGVAIRLCAPAASLLLTDGCCQGVVLANGETIRSDAVIIATGGLSYPSTGSTGDGYQWAQAAGHTVTSLSPALVPFNAVFPDGSSVQELQGLTLKNVRVSLWQGTKKLVEGFGEMLFTHFGVSGPVLLSASSQVTKAIRQGPLRLGIDWKPALTVEQLDARMLREFEAGQNKQLKNVLGSLLPSGAIPAVIYQSGISADKKIHDITKEERRRLVEGLKDFSLTITGLRDYNEAIITQGGIQVKEILPATMKSRKAEHLYFAGEILDVDAFTGGYNLQIAWSTGYAAGMAAARQG